MPAPSAEDPRAVRGARHRGWVRRHRHGHLDRARRLAGPGSPCPAPLLRAQAHRAAQEDFSIDLGTDVEFNPVLEHYLRSEQGLQVDTDALEDMATTGNGFDPYPVYAALTHLCGAIPDFAVAPRLVVGTFSYAKLPMVADLAAQGAALADHDVVAALAGDPGRCARCGPRSVTVRPMPTPRAST